MLHLDSNIMHIRNALKGGVENGGSGRRDSVTGNTTHWFGQGSLWFEAIGITTSFPRIFA